MDDRKIFQLVNITMNVCGAFAFGVWQHDFNAGLFMLCCLWLLK